MALTSSFVELLRLKSKFGIFGLTSFFFFFNWETYLFICLKFEELYINKEDNKTNKLTKK